MPLELFLEVGAEETPASFVARAVAQLPAFGAVVTELKDPIDRFFEKVFVMVEDQAVRTNRLRMLRDVSDATVRVAHLHLLQETT